MMYPLYFILFIYIFLNQIYLLKYVIKAFYYIFQIFIYFIFINHKNIIMFNQYNLFHVYLLIFINLFFNN